MVLSALNEIYNNCVLIDEPMSKHTSFRIGGPVKFLVEPTNTDQLIKTLEVCKRLKIGRASCRERV